MRAWSLGLHTAKGNYYSQDLLHWQADGSDCCGFAVGFVSGQTERMATYGAIVTLCEKELDSMWWVKREGRLGVCTRCNEKRPAANLTELKSILTRGTQNTAPFTFCGPCKEKLIFGKSFG